MYVVELLIRILAVGPIEYFRKWWNRYLRAIVIVVVIVVVVIVFSVDLILLLLALVSYYYVLRRPLLKL